MCTRRSFSRSFKASMSCRQFFCLFPQPPQLLRPKRIGFRKKKSAIVKSRKVRILYSQVLTFRRLTDSQTPSLETLENQYPGILEMWLQHSEFRSVLTDSNFHNISAVIIDEAHWTPPAKTTIQKMVCLGGPWADENKVKSFQGGAAWASATFLVSWQTSFLL